MLTYQFDHLYSITGWLSPGYVSIDADGWIVAASGVAPIGEHVTLGGIAVPGISNVHSHAFQRAMAGFSEHRTSAETDSFWTWRELMYHFVNQISPDDLEAIAAQLYVEMLKVGYTAVGEFQYVHHDRDGTAFGNPAEMSLRTLIAAHNTGIGITILPVLYEYAGFGGRKPERKQRRFINNSDTFLKIFEVLKEETSQSENQNIGVAPHSLRAAGRVTISDVVGAIDASTPIHIHVAEQEKEVVECKSFYGMSPVQYLLRQLPVDSRWCLIHATHMTSEEIRGAAKAEAIAGLCPTTEANLGDGLFNLPGWQNANGTWGIGSDSQISVSPIEELRWLEYGQRLRDRRRNIFANELVSTGEKLVDAAVIGGAQALGRKGRLGETGIQVGARADIVVLDLQAPLFAGHTTATFLDAWIFSGNTNVVEHVFVGGVHVIKYGKHAMEKKIKTRFKKTITNLLASDRRARRLKQVPQAAKQFKPGGG